MEIPVINRMTELEASIDSLNNPSSFISRLVSAFELDSLHFSLPFHFWKWGALFLAFLYAFTSFAYKIKILICYFHDSKSESLSSDPLLSHFADGFSSSDDEDDDACSSSDDEAEEGPTSSYDDLTRFDDGFLGVKGGFGNFGEYAGQKLKLRLRRRRSCIGDSFSLADLVSGNGVVNLWESTIPAVSISPTVIFTAGAGEDGKFGLGLWDLRMKLESPAVQAEWWSDRRGDAVGIDAGRTGKVYVSDDVSTGLSVGDVRKMDTALENLTEVEEDTWGDADGVTLTSESKNEFTR